jgi:hypothetical protein
VSPGEPWPATDQPVNGVLGTSWYAGVGTDTPIDEPVVHVYYGGHLEVVSDAEASLLTAAGFGPNLTPVP